MARKTLDTLNSFEVDLIDINVINEYGRFYTEDVCKLIEKQLDTNKITVYDTIYIKKYAKTNIYDLVKENTAYGEVISSDIRDNKLWITISPYSNSYGKKLMNLLQSSGLDAVSFLPIGYGTDVDGCIQNDYTILYIGIEPQNLRLTKNNF